MKAIEVMAIIGLILGAIFLVYPQETGEAINDIIHPVPHHLAVCDVLLHRTLGNPYISTTNCYSGNECNALTSINLQENFGDYVGNVKMQIGTKTQTKGYTIGLGLPFAPANTQLQITQCIADGTYPSMITLMDGSGYILDTKQVTITVP
jgi:hypothetical protein